MSLRQEIEDLLKMSLRDAGISESLIDLVRVKKSNQPGVDFQSNAFILFRDQ